MSGAGVGVGVGANAMGKALEIAKTQLAMSGERMMGHRSKLIIGIMSIIGKNFLQSEGEDIETKFTPLARDEVEHGWGQLRLQVGHTR